MLAGRKRASSVSSSPADEVEVSETADCNDKVLPPSSVAPNGRGEAATNRREGGVVLSAAVGSVILFNAAVLDARSSIAA